jgi:hypothetical protein
LMNMYEKHRDNWWKCMKNNEHPWKIHEDQWQFMNNAVTIDEKYTHIDGKLMNIDKHWWTLMEIDEYLWKIHGNWWTFVNIYGQNMKTDEHLCKIDESCWQTHEHRWNLIKND